MKVERRARGPAYANLQGRKPREAWRGGASDAMGISALAVCGRGTLIGSLVSGRRGSEFSRPIATGRTVAARRRLIDETIVHGGAMASTVMGGREPSKQKRS